MDPKTHAAMTQHRPSLEAALQLLRQAEKESPDKTTGFELLLQARAELEHVFSAVVEVEESEPARHAAELKHLLAKTSTLAARALNLNANAIALLSSPLPGDSAKVHESLVTAGYALGSIEMMVRTGNCGCLAGECAYRMPTVELPAKPPKPAGFRKSHGPFIRTSLRLVKPGEGGGAA